MVNLMLQPVFLNLVKGSTDHKMTSDDLYNMWSVSSRAKSAIVQGRRLENLSWRLWYTSTIRAKIEMEEKRRLINETTDIDHNYVDVDDINVHCDSDETFIETETENESTASTSSSCKKKKRKESALVLPSDRPLFTSTCTSILAEIQDASIRFSSSAISGVGASGFNNLNQSHFQNNITTHHHHLYNSHFNNQNQQNQQNVHIVSPPIHRAKSPGTSFSSTNFTPKRKKNVEKFLKKFKSKLEDISEYFDEKLTLTDEETDVTDINANTMTDASVKSLSPTASSNHFATDEEGQFSSFYSRNDGGLINMENPVNYKKKSQPSMISMLLNKDGNSENTTNSPHNVNNVQLSEPVQIQIQNENDNNNFIDIDRNRNRNEPNSPITQNYQLSPHQPDMAIEKRVIDATALSTSLSASKFKLEDEFDSQLVICFYNSPSCSPLTPKMAKKPGERKLNNPEAYERINYLLYLCTSSIIIAFTDLKREKIYLTPAVVKTEMKNVIELTRGYVKTLREVAKKSVIRLAPNTKRSLCKKCNCFLLPSITSKIRYTRRKKRDWTAIRCVQCGNVERYLLPKDPFKEESTENDEKTS